MGACCDVTVAIVNWNTCDLLADCLESLASGTIGLRTKVVVVDNASRDGSAAMVARRFSHVHLIANAQNLGYARGNNQAYALAEGRYVLLLNPDTVVCPQAVSRMIEFLDGHQDAAGVTCRLLNPDGTFQRYYKRLPSWRYVLSTFTLFNNLFPSNRWVRQFYMVDDRFDVVREIEQPPASCLLIRQDIVPGSTLFDERFPILFNDIDLCRTFQDAGHRLYYLPAAEVIHYGGGGGVNTMKDDAIVDYQIGLIRYNMKHGGVVVGTLLWVLLNLNSMLVLGGGLVKVMVARRSWSAFSAECRRRFRLALGREVFRYPTDVEIVTT